MIKNFLDLALKNRIIKHITNTLPDIQGDDNVKLIVDMIVTVGRESATFQEFVDNSAPWDLSIDFCKVLWQVMLKLDYTKNPSPLERFYQTHHEELERHIVARSDFPSLKMEDQLPADFLKGRGSETMSGIAVKDLNELIDMTMTDVPQKAILRKPRNDYAKWELAQLRASGIAPAAEIQQAEEDEAELNATDRNLIDIEVKITEPKFLKGQTEASGAKMDNLVVLRNPDGSLARTAAKSVLLTRERKEHRELERGHDKYSKPAPGSAVNSRPWESENERALAKHRRYVDIRALGPRVEPNKSILQRRRELPIYKFREELLNAIRDNDILILIGETGSGKTTQLPQYLLESGFAKHGQIGCTQPRRVAATSIAQRVCEEYGCRLGQEVGYTIRFEDMTSVDTVIKYMTDGILLRECILDPELRKYSVLILDEAHERTIATDVLFGLLKKIQRGRKLRNNPDANLKLIITSATLNAEQFSAYFLNAPIFRIPGRSFPVEIFYATTPETDYIEASLMTVLQIHLTEPAGDILLFLTGQEEIESACAALSMRMGSLADKDPPPLIILPVYASLPSELQTLIFEPVPPGCRKCVIATNIAEASLTIDGIKYVVDPGLVKMKIYSSKTCIESLTVVPISQSNALQRSGRAGRTSHGKCFRLYTAECFENEMLKSAVPEIQRSDLCAVILQLKALGVNDLLHFDFMDKPPICNMIKALEILYELKALDDDGYLTPLGRHMAEFPMEPQMSKVLLTSLDLSVGEEMCTISSMLQVDNIFYRPKDKFEQAEKKKARFTSSDGDHIMYLNIFNHWTQNSYSKTWCYENFLHYSGLKHAQEIRKQLLSILSRYSDDFKRKTSASASLNHQNRSQHQKAIGNCHVTHEVSAKLRQAICAGYFRNIARRDQKEGYRTLIDDQQVYLHPMSSLHSTQAEYILYHRLMLTTKEYIRDCCVINPKWLPIIAPHLYVTGDPRRLTAQKMREKIQPLLSKHEDPLSWRLSKRRI